MNEELKLLLMLDARENATQVLEKVQGGLLKILGSAGVLSQQGKAKLAELGGAVEGMATKTEGSVKGAEGAMTAYEQHMAQTTTKIEQHLASIRQAATGATGDVAKVGGAVEGMATNVEGAASKVEQAAAGAGTAVAGVAGAGSTLEGATAGAGEKIAAGLAPGTAALGGTALAADEVGTHVSGMRAAVGSGAMVAGAGLLAIGLAAGAMAVKSVGAAQQFQTGLTALVTGAGEAKSNIDLISSGVLALAGKVGESPQKLVQALYPIESAGFHGAAALDVLKASAEGAKVGMADQATVADAVTSALNAYHLPASAAVSVTDELVTAVGQGKMHMQDLAVSLGGILPEASALGVSLPEVTGAIATMTMQGLPARNAATGLRFALSALANPTKKSADTLAQMGLSSAQVQASLGKQGLGATLNMITTAMEQHLPAGVAASMAALKTLGKETAAAGKALQHAQAAQQGLADKAKFAGDAETKAALALDHLQQSGKASADQIAAANITLSDARVKAQQAGAAYAANQQQVTTLQTSYATLNTKLHQQTAAFTASHASAGDQVAALANVVGGVRGLTTALLLGGQNAQTFAANTRAIADAGQQAGSAVKGWSTVQGDLSTQTDRVKASLAAVSVSLGMALIPLVSKLLTAVLPVIQAVTDWVTQNPQLAAGILAATAALGTLLGMVGIVAGAMLLFSTVALGPIILVIAGVVAAIAGIILIFTHWGQITATVGAAFSAFGTKVQQVAQAVVQWFQSNWPIIVIVLLLLLGPIGIIALAVIHFRDQIGQAFGAVVQAVSGAVATVGQQLQDLGQWFSRRLNEALGIIRGFLAPMTQVGRDLIQGLLDGIGSMASAVGSKVHDIVNALPGVAKQILGISSPSKVFGVIGEQTMQGLAQGINTGGSQTVAAVKTQLAATAAAAVQQAHQMHTQVLRSITQLQHDTTAKVKELRTQMAADIKDLRVQTTEQVKQLEAESRKHIADLRSASLHDTKAMKHEVAQQIKDLRYQTTEQVKKLREDTALHITALRANTQQQIQLMQQQTVQQATLMTQKGQQQLTQLQTGGVSSATALSAGTVQQLDLMRGKAEGVMITFRDHLLTIYSVLHDDAYAAGRAIGEGLRQGIVDQINAIRDAAISAAEGAIAAAKAALGVHSPSTVFAEIGQNVVLGFSQGISGGQPALATAGAGLAGAAVSGALEPARPAAGAGGGGTVVYITGNYLMSERDLEDLATKVGQVLVSQTSAAYSLIR